MNNPIDIIHLYDEKINTLQAERDKLVDIHKSAASRAIGIRPKGAEHGKQVVEIMGHILGAFDECGGGYQKFGQSATNFELVAGRKNFRIRFQPTLRGDKHVLFFTLFRGACQTMWKGYFGVDVGTLIGGRLHLEMWRRPRQDHWEAPFLQELVPVMDRWITGPLPFLFLNAER